VRASFPDFRRPRAWLILVGLLILLAGLGQLFTTLFPQEEKEARQVLRKALEQRFPRQAGQTAESYGLGVYDPKPAPAGESPRLERPVVLIHGLDDPGTVWMNLAPALAREGFVVLIMRYPNDQPILDSARLLAQELALWRARGLKRAALVAHSMGGLVAREMLTNPELAYAGESRTGGMPRVEELIMIGTPNHGSELARLSLVTEIRDQLVNLWQGQGHWLGWILDGAGEARIDLLPGSRFLTALNSRPNQEKVKMLVIAGLLSPWDGDQLDRLGNLARTRLPDNMDYLIDDIERYLKSVSNGLGDGLVSLNSARLEGVDLLTVEGTHLSMIRNLDPESGRTPPAVPLVIRRLKESFAP